MSRGSIVLVTGGRDFRDAALFWRTMNSLYERLQFGTVVHGACATGADAMVRPWVLSRVNMKGFGPMIIRPFPADWKTHVCRVDSRCRSRSTCRAAGPVRNQLMVDRAQPDMCVAFPGGTGTEDCVTRALRAGVNVEYVGKHPPFDVKRPWCFVKNAPRDADTCNTCFCAGCQEYFADGRR